MNLQLARLTGPVPDIKVAMGTVPAVNPRRVPHASFSHRTPFPNSLLLCTHLSLVPSDLVP
jgi:hypothetical protein